MPLGIANGRRASGHESGHLADREPGEAAVPAAPARVPRDGGSSLREAVSLRCADARLARYPTHPAGIDDAPEFRRTRCWLVSNLLHDLGERLALREAAHPCTLAPALGAWAPGRTPISR